MSLVIVSGAKGTVASIALRHLAVAALMTALLTAASGIELALISVAPLVLVGALGTYFVPRLLERELALPGLHALSDLLVVVSAVGSFVLSTLRAFTVASATLAGGASTPTPAVSVDAQRVFWWASGMSLDLWLWGLIVVAVAFQVASFLATIRAARRTGFAWRAIPFLVWTLVLGGSFYLASSVPALVGLVVLVGLGAGSDARAATAEPALWTHVYWQHGPEIYLQCLPLVGLIVHYVVPLVVAAQREGRGKPDRR